MGRSVRRLRRDDAWLCGSTPTHARVGIYHPAPRQALQRRRRSGKGESGVNRSDESRLLGLGLGAAAGAQLTRWRGASLVPDRLAPVRREIEVASSIVQLLGAATLCVPALRQLARWVNVCAHVGAIAGILNRARHPERFHRSRTWPFRSLLAPVRIPLHVGAIGLIFWVTRSTSAAQRSGSAGAHPPISRATGRLPRPNIDDDRPDSELAAEEA